MNTSKRRDLLRRARQEKRLHSLSVEEKQKHPGACKSYIIYGGDLEKIKEYHPPQMMKRQARALGMQNLQHAIMEKFKVDKKQIPSFSDIRTMATDLKRKAMRRVRKKSVM